MFYISLILSFFIACVQNPTSPSDNDNNSNGNTNPNLTIEQQQYVSELNTIAFSVNGSSPDLGDNDLSVFDAFKDAQIVGLGEATHGTKEFFQMKHRIFKYLVEHHGFRCFGFECDFAESIYFDRWITEGVGDLKSLMMDKMHFWTWRTEEVKALLEWMREYNLDKTEDEKIHYLGFDCQFMTYNGELLTTYLNRVSPDFLDEWRSFLDYTSTLDYYSYQSMTDSVYQTVDINLISLYTQFSALEDSFLLQSSKFEYDISHHLVRVMIRTHRSKYADAHGTSPRDNYMAQNVTSLLDIMNQEKIVLWAHNGHVAKDVSFIQDGSMGYFLKNIYGTDYQVVGFSFSTGQFTAYHQSQLQSCTITQTPRDDSINYLFHCMKSPNFVFLRSDVGMGTSVSGWFSDLRPFLTIGAGFYGPDSYNYVRLLNECDAIVHFDVTEASILLY